MSGKIEIIDGKTYRKKVRAIIFNEKNEFLLIRPNHYKNDVWTFIGGGTEDNESLEESVVREISEEVGIHNLITLQKSGFTNSYLYKNEHQSKFDGQIAYYFVANVKSDTSITIQAEELADYCWVHFEKIAKYVQVKQQLDFFYILAEEFGWKSKMKTA